MKVTTRRVVIAGAAAAAAGGTLAAAALWRKPPPAVFTQSAAGSAPGLAPFSTFVPRETPAPPAPAIFFNGEGVERRITDFPRQGLVLNLWATWCVPCVAEMPALQAMARALADDKIAVLPLSSDRGGAPTVRKFYEQHDISALGVWLDPKGEAARAWGARGLPTTLIVDRHGREVARLEGAIDWASADALARIRTLVGPAS